MSGSPNFAIVDATTLELIGTVNDPQCGTFTGIAIDDVNNIFYATHRFPDYPELPTGLYAYEWDPDAKTLSPIEGNPVDITPDSGSYVGFGLAVDEINERLYVAHFDWGGGPSYVGVYNLGTWEEIMRIYPSLPCVGLAVDRVRGFVYTTAQDEGGCVAPGDNTLLSKHDLATELETTVDMGHGGMGIAVDEANGYVYVTGGCTKRNLTVWDSNLNHIQTIDDIGLAPAGIAIGNVTEEALIATIDIDPDTLNLKSKGNWITCYIELPEGHDVNQIDVNTVTLSVEGATPIAAALSPTEVGDYDSDDIPDLMVKFDRGAVQDVVPVGSMEMTVTGSLTDGTQFQGTDTVLVIDTHK
jgi:DNA-binding beta-propeller fold protein YncE